MYLYNSHSFSETFNCFLVIPVQNMKIYKVIDIKIFTVKLLPARI